VSLHAETLIDTPIEPEHIAAADTLEQAARRNDFQAFEALYATAHDARWRAVHDVWTYAESEKIGAFYGAAMHDQLAAAYPGFAEYIEDYRVVDANGVAWYPSAETRRFFMDAAVNPPVERQASSPVVSPRAVSPRVVSPRVVSHPIVSPPVVEPRPVVAPPAPVRQARTPVAPPQRVVAQAQPEDHTIPALFLILAALAGIGAMTLLAQTPKARPLPPIERQYDNVSEPPDEHRATGSHG
jgi:hypothetical protein